MDVCGATFRDPSTGIIYYCSYFASSHPKDHHRSNQIMSWAIVKSSIEVQLDSAIANGESYRLANIELSKKLEQAKEDEAYLVNKVKNQAKSLTEMHKGIKHANRRAEYHREKWEHLEAIAKQLKVHLKLHASGTYGLDYYAVKKENDGLRKELADLRENFTFNENSWKESNEHLKERLNNVLKRLDDALVEAEKCKEINKQTSEALGRATDLLRKIRRFVREIGL